ncbi:Uncharacterised protein [BD1-7 clade bacterium]|uniref:3-deoxy-D-manno-octulosonic acid kinase n=1 Tax=BD1-7 clade bacterium TaxID=2029982 RepID=A0A5S9PKF7_9GAMM|nr:Uncharacterised protein [BD1-7 clade bacterium]
MYFTAKLSLYSESIPQLFVGRSASKPLRDDDRSIAKVIHTGGPSEVGVSKSGRFIVKLIKTRTWHERGKALWGHSRLNKEITGNRLLKKLGIQVPKILETAVYLLPLIGKTFLGYYIMENLHPKGFHSITDLLESRSLQPNELERIIDLFYIDLLKMRTERIVYSDLHLGNLMSDHEQLVWIDTGVSNHRWSSNKKFERKFNDSIRRLLKSKAFRAHLSAYQQKFQTLMFA